MRNVKILKYISLAIALIGFSLGANARPTIEAKLDSASILMGSMTNLKITVDQEENFRGYLPLMRSAIENGYVGVCGDSVELRAPSVIDTVRKDNRLRITFDIPVQSFDSGYYNIPGIEFISGVDTFRSNRVALRVLPVNNVTAETPIEEYANIAKPEGGNIFDSLPDWLFNYWWLLLIIVAALGVVFWLWRRYKSNGGILPKKPEPTPYESAISGLKELQSRKLWENGMEKEYYTELTDILRTYLYRRFGINAVEMTSRQILAALSKNNDTKERRGMIRQILDMADFVKFAKVRPLPPDNVKAMENAIQFVEETTPVAVVPEDDKKGGEK